MHPASSYYEYLEKMNVDLSKAGKSKWLSAQIGEYGSEDIEDQFYFSEHAKA